MSGGEQRSPTMTKVQPGQITAAAEKLAAGERAPAGQLAALLRDMFVLAGLNSADAEIATDSVMYATLRGIESHGVYQMPLYLTGLLDGTIKCAPNVQLSGDLPCCRVMDADNGLGLIVSRNAVDVAMALAREFGLGAVAVRNSSHFGTAGYYAEYAAKHDLIGLAFCNASPALAPPGGREPLLGTNPIGVGFPLPDADPIVADMATTVVARSRIRRAKALGETIPEGWAFDKEGKPTSDPAAAVEGTLAAIGGPKGYALSLMTELLCSALSDGPPGFEITYENVVKRPSRIGQFFLVMNPEGFAGMERYGHRADHISRTLLGATRLDDAVAPRLPGERGHAVRRAHEQQGFEMTAAFRRALLDAETLLRTRLAPR